MARGHSCRRGTYAKRRDTHTATRRGGIKPGSQSSDDGNPGKKPPAPPQPQRPVKGK